MTLRLIVIPPLAVAAGCAAPAPPLAEPVKASPPAAVAPGKAAAPARAPAAAPAKVPAAASAAKPAPPPPLDLKSLEQRLKATSAIGVLTKLSLKNQVDDLVARFKAYHDGTRPPALAELRPAYELLIMKVLSLLQDQDKALANDINASRDAIWGVLTDRQKLSAYL